MNVVVNTQDLLLILLAFIALVFILFIFKKIIIIFFTLIVLAGLLYYVFVLSNMIRPPQKHAKYSIEVIKQKYCDNMQTRKDSIKCFYIITPICNDMEKTFSEQELLNLEKNPIEYYKIVKASMQKNKKQIIRNLTKAKEKQLWNSFVKDISKTYETNDLSR